MWDQINNSFDDVEKSKYWPIKAQWLLHIPPNLGFKNCIFEDSIMGFMWF